MAKPRTVRISWHDPDATDSSGDESFRRVRRVVVREISCCVTRATGGDGATPPRRARRGSGRKKELASATWQSKKAAAEEDVIPNSVFAGYESGDELNTLTSPNSVLRKVSSLSPPFDNKLVGEAKGGKDTGGLSFTEEPRLLTVFEEVPMYNEFSDLRVTESAIFEDATWVIGTGWEEALGSLTWCEDDFFGEMRDFFVLDSLSAVL
ncbi:uncharacterized protein [Typha latifolia]|uniref:uncharacterized protein n=1 Tax=Typha latifolia TaxID=4733 RepID=UPI003C2E6799